MDDIDAPDVAFFTVKPLADAIQEELIKYADEQESKLGPFPFLR